MPLVTNEEINSLPEELRPQLTGHLVKKTMNGDSYSILLEMYSAWKRTKDIGFYHRFRQGLDVLDLDGITYEMIGMNPNSMGYWFPALEKAASVHNFLKIPVTKIVKVPLPILQLTRLDYFSLTPTTLHIVDAWARKVFELDANNEWVVREYIEDKENLPCIYHGMPLHTEYRAFVDFDADELIGIVPYWDAETMKRRFSQESDAGTADMKHDYIIYCKEEKRLQSTFDVNKECICEHLRDLIPDVDLPGQWSLDIMQNGNDFWLIDMALAANSAFSDKMPIRFTIPEENWIPKLNLKK